MVFTRSTFARLAKRVPPAVRHQRAARMHKITGALAASVRKLNHAPFVLGVLAHKKPFAQNLTCAQVVETLDAFAPKMTRPSEPVRVCAESDDEFDTDRPCMHCNTHIGQFSDEKMCTLLFKPETDATRAAHCGYDLHGACMGELGYRRIHASQTFLRNVFHCFYNDDSDDLWYLRFACPAHESDLAKIMALVLDALVAFAKCQRSAGCRALSEARKIALDDDTPVAFSTTPTRLRELALEMLDSIKDEREDESC